MLKLKDIPLGSTDAKNEVLSSSPDEFERFKNAFVIPPALTIEKYLSGTGTSSSASRAQERQLYFDTFPSSSRKTSSQLLVSYYSNQMWTKT